MRNALYILLFLSLSNNDLGKWELKKTKDNIEIYTRDLESSSFKEFKATSVFKASFEDLLQQLYEAPAYTKSCDYNVSYRVQSKSSPDKYFYYKQELPWPLKDRDVVTKLSIKEQTDSYIKLVLEAVPNIIQEEPNMIRISELSGFWLLEKHPKGVKATQQIFMDPAGKVPAFIVNPLLVKGPLKTFEELHHKLEGDK